MTFKYKDDAVKSEYEVVYLSNDDSDYKSYTYVTAYSAKQAEYFVKKKYPNCYRILSVNQLKEIPDENGKQLMMDI